MAHETYADVVARVRAAAAGVPGVTDVGVRLGRPFAAEPPSTDTPHTDARTDLPPAIVHGPPFTLPPDAPATLTDALTRAAAMADQRGTTYVLAGGGEHRQTYRDLLAEASRMLSGLRAHGLRPGESVLLHCDDNRNFVTGFWACVLGGFVPTPIAVAPTYQWENATTRRIRDAWELLDRPPLLTDRPLLAKVGALRALWQTTALEILAAEDLSAGQSEAEPYPADPEHPVVHLLTSGSTGVPKCVRHVHRTVLTRAYVNAAVNDFGPADVTLNFMPLDHVAGMVMHNLRDVILGCEHVNARTDSFLADPLRWFDWIEHYKVTNTSAPNFVITLVTKLADDIGRRRWDLSSLRDITNGGEAIVSSTMHDFLRMLAPHGLAPDVMRPAWGMSEICGGAVHSTLSRDVESQGIVTIDHWGADGALTFLPGPRPGHATFTEVGVPAPGTSARIVDERDAVLSADRVGRLQVRGVTKMVGYHGNPDATAAATTEDGWFDTGDLGFVHNGRLTMTGRAKDLIVIRSANYPCHEIESVVESVPGVLPTFAAACAEHDAESGTDELVVFCVLNNDEHARRREALREIAARLSKQIGLAPRRVVAVPKGDFPKTSAGKIERQRLLAGYRAGQFAEQFGAPRSVDDTSLLYGQRWVQMPAMPGPLPEGVWLVFDADGLAERLRDAPVVTVLPGGSWERRSATDYRIDPIDDGHYRDLLAAVRAEHGEIGAVVHAWSIGPVAETPAAYQRALDLSALSVHRLLKAGTQARLVVLTTSACPVDEDDPVTPVHATVNGLVRTANAEAGARQVRQLDLRPDHSDPASAVLAELSDRGADDILTYRDGRRLVPRVRPVLSIGQPAQRIRPGGLYLVTGGLGGIGRHIAALLTRRHGAKLVLIGRSEPSGDRLAWLDARPGVMYHRADVTDVDALRDAVAAAEQRFGRELDGVFHLAGADIDGNWADLRTHLLTGEDTAEFRRMYHTKVFGTRAVGQLLEDRQDALLVVASSVNGFFGGTAFGAYSSASSFLPAFVEQWRRRGRAGQCHSWSRWGIPDDGIPGRAALARHGFRPIEPEHGAQLCLAALGNQDANVLIGLDDGGNSVIGAIDPSVLDDTELIVTYRATTARDTEVRDAVRAVLPYGRLRIEHTGTTDAAAPDERTAGDLERAVAEIWRTTLRRTVVGIGDHFFDLGGNSLTAMVLVDRLNGAFDGELTVQDLYEKPTVAQLAAQLRTET